jgi:type III restriction enzyme
VTPEQLERIKLEDGIHCHENVKAELDIYARQSGRQKVPPFMLVVAQRCGKPSKPMTSLADAIRAV